MAEAMRSIKDIVTVNQAAIFPYLIQRLGPRGFIMAAILGFKDLAGENTEKLTYTENRKILMAHYAEVLERVFSDDKESAHG